MVDSNIYVCGIPNGLEESIFKQLFEPFGTIVSVKSCLSKKGSLGYGFVKFSTHLEAVQAITVMNGYDFHGAKLVVKLATTDTGKGGWHGGLPPHGGIGPGPGISVGAVALALAGVTNGGKKDGRANGTLAASQAAASGWTGALPWGGAVAAAQAAAAAAPAAAAGTEAAGAGTNVYVAGLPETVDEQALRTLFEGFGTVLSCKLNSESTYGKKYGFVRYSSPMEALIAMSSMNNFDYSGNKLQVRLAHSDPGWREAVAVAAAGGVPTPAAAAGAAAGSTGGYAALLNLNSVGVGAVAALPGGGAAASMTSALSGGAPSDNLYIKGLPPAMTEQALAEIFTVYGIVRSTRVLDSSGLAGDSIALVRMGSVEEAAWIVENLNGQIPRGLQSPVSVKFAESRSTEARVLKQAALVAERLSAVEAADAAGVADAAAAQAASSSRYSPYGAGAGAAASPVRGSAASPELMQAISETVSTVKGFPTGTGPDGTDESSLYIRGLPPGADDLYLYQVFAPFGAMQSVHCMLDASGMCRGVGVIQYGFPEDAKLALATLNGNPLPDGQVLQVTVKSGSGKQS